MARMGMDVDAVESVGRQLKQSADAVDGIVGSIDKTVSGLTAIWDGPDAQRFVQQTWPGFRKALIAAQASVAGLGQSALNNASEQREASSVQGVGHGGGATPSTPMPPSAATPIPGAPPGSTDGGARAAFEKWRPADGTPFVIGASDIECVGLVNDYANHLFPGVPYSATVGAPGAAMDMWNTASSQYFEKIPAGQPPQPGDVVVVGSNQWSPTYGHVAVVETVNGNLPGHVVEQSGPNSTYPSGRATFTGNLSTQEDAAIIGYLRPKVSG